MDKFPKGLRLLRTTMLLVGISAAASVVASLLSSFGIIPFLATILSYAASLLTFVCFFLQLGGYRRAASGKKAFWAAYWVLLGGVLAIIVGMIVFSVFSGSKIAQAFKDMSSSGMTTEQIAKYLSQFIESTYATPIFIIAIANVLINVVSYSFAYATCAKIDPKSKVLAYVTLALVAVPQIVNYILPRWGAEIPGVTYIVLAMNACIIASHFCAFVLYGKCLAAVGGVPTPAAKSPSKEPTSAPKAEPSHVRAIPSSSPKEEKPSSSAHASDSSNGNNFKKF